MTIKEQYKKERRRILGYLSDMRRRGYNTENVVVPKIPKQIRAGSVRKLQKITAKSMREDIYYISAFTGEYAPASARNRVNRIRSDDIFYEQDIEKLNPNVVDALNDDEFRAASIIMHFRLEIKNMNNEYAWNIITQWLDGWIGTMGANAVAKVLEDAAQAGFKCTVTEADSYGIAKQKSLNFISKIMELSGEYSQTYIDEFVSDLDMNV